MNKNIDVVALLSELVACPSVNPAERKTFRAPYGEGALADLLAARLRSWGAQVELREVVPGRPNVIACFEGKDTSRSLMLEAHSDTVQASDMTIPPFAPTVRNGRLYGRGACDTKGPMAAMLQGLRQVLDADGQPPVTVYFVSTCDEEQGARGARALIQKDFRPDWAVVGEPTDLAICHAHKGTLRWAIETQGVAVHSSAPTRGVNAIYHMTRVIDMIEREIAPSLRSRQHALLGEATISVGVIRGGTQSNVVPAACMIEIDRRLLPGESAEAITAAMRGQLDALKAKTPTFAYTLQALQHYEPLEVPTDSAACRLAAEACGRVLPAAKFVTAPWSSNAGVFAALGVPCVLFGPGSIQQAHTKDEYIDLRELEQAVDVYAAIIRQCASARDWPQPLQKRA